MARTTMVSKSTVWDQHSVLLLTNFYFKFEEVQELRGI